MKIIPYLMLLIACCSCNSNQTNSIPANSTTASKTVADTGHYDRLTNLNLHLTDTIKRSVGMAFSDTSFKDQFVLTIPPGKVKETRSRLQIISPDGKILYTQQFETLFFVKLIVEPEKIPSTVGPYDYDKYVDQYCRSLTAAQFESYFKKNVDSFFNDIYPITRNNYQNLKNDGEIADPEFFKEIFSDESISLYDITCFDCSEGSAIIGYSKKRKKVLTLLEHD